MARLRDPDMVNCFGEPLKPEEYKSLVKCLDSAQLGVDTCLVDGLPALQEHLIKYCRAVAASQTDDLELVEGAMLLIEQLSMSLGQAVPPEGSQPRFSGQWQMLVATGGGWPYGRLQYVPIIELLEVSEDGQRFRLESKAGPLYTSAVGNVTWVRPPNRLQYHVTDFRVELLGASLGVPAPAPDNELLVFASAPGIALARSAAGGMTLMGQPV
ncbi:hypothetical protein GPECTOR_53g97 [Gonium pectorale]|uniref:Plastid lipid-associated protein/fibrillin conserved domain-containing protein n=1 Tax=Gonium pectorale TaxID=33097 RepID=A0A150G6Z3_GONPE|nr:hypothetical protein GPECTOR_53g97 [Gonium pectorale]|eukprot:KXZ45604.1 hypothetical protein GPECTOR_53g97 [Gonium pectorale]